MTLLSGLVSAIIPILLSYLSDRMGAENQVREKRDGLKALSRAKTGIEVASVWKRHDNDIDRLLQKATTKRSKRHNSC